MNPNLSNAVCMYIYIHTLYYTLKHFVVILIVKGLLYEYAFICCTSNVVTWNNLLPFFRIWDRPRYGASFSVATPRLEASTPTPGFPDRPGERGHGRRLAATSSSDGRQATGEILQRRMKSVGDGEGRRLPPSSPLRHGDPSSPADLIPAISPSLGR